MMKQAKFKIGDYEISDISMPYIIAEIGSNFDQDFNKACKLIEIASQHGANAVKFQLFKAENLYPNKDSLYNLFKDIELNQTWIPRLQDCARNNNIDFLASSFDLDSFEILEKYKVLAHKIASSEITNLSFLNKVAQTGKPVLISTGMSDFVDIEEAINIMDMANNKNICIMQCSSIYPLNHEDVNLNVIKAFRNRYDYVIGFSDHTLDNIASITALGIGSRVFEKHITLNRKDSGPDHFYALEPEQLKKYIDSIRSSYKCLGSSQKNLLQQEKEIGRRESIYAKYDLEQNHILKSEDLIIKRPCIGIRSRYISSLIGCKLKNKLKKDHPISFSDIK